MTDERLAEIEYNVPSLATRDFKAVPELIAEVRQLRESVNFWRSSVEEGERIVDELTAEVERLRQ